MEKDRKLLAQLILGSIEPISCNKESSVDYLREEGLNPDSIREEGMRGLKQLQLQLNAAKTKREMVLFTTVSGRPICHGDDFWCFYEGQKHSANRMRANRKWDYNDGQPRFATKEEAQEAIRVYAWLNSPYDGN